MMNKKAIAFVPVIWIGLFLAVLYIGLLLPIPAFKAIRMSINFFLVVGVWVVLQVLIFYLYFKGGKLVVRGIHIYRNSLSRWTTNFEKWLTTH